MLEDNKPINNPELLKQELQKLYSYLKNELKIKEDPRVFFNTDDINADKIFGKTGFYNPQTKEIHLFIKNRHIKDILRSFAHEIIHHQQNLQGRMPPQEEKNLKSHYFLEDKYLRELEAEAYEKGNMLFRQYTEYVADDEENETKYLKENKMKKIVDIVKRKLDDEEKNEDIKSHFEKRNEQIYERLMEKVKKTVKEEKSEEGENI